MRIFLALATTLALLVVVDGVGAQEPQAPRPLPSMPAPSAPAVPVVTQPAPVVQTTEYQPSGRRGVLRRWRERRMARRNQ